MTCPHAETTAILALFDEAPPGFGDHLRGCAECQKTIGEHRETISLIAPHLAAPQAQPVQPVQPVQPTRSLWPAALLSTIAAAAAVALLVLSAPTTPATAPPERLAVLDEEGSQLDDDLLALELELALMNLEDH